MDANEADSYGGAVYCYLSDPTIENCRLTNNMGDCGGAIYCEDSWPIISNTLIANNTSAGGGPRCGGICAGYQYGAPELRNCTIVHNSPGGISAGSWDGMIVTNTIVWGNEMYQIQTPESSPVVTFCDVQGGFPGTGNWSTDPAFFSPSAGTGIEYDGSAANWALQSQFALHQCGDGPLGPAGHRRRRGRPEGQRGARPGRFREPVESASADDLALAHGRRGLRAAQRERDHPGKDR